MATAITGRAAEQTPERPYPLSVPPQEAEFRWRPADPQAVPPDWLQLHSRFPLRTGEWIVVKTDPCADESQCDQALELLLEREFARLVTECTEQPTAATFIRRAGRDLRRRYVGKDTYHEVADSQVGVLHVKYARMRVPAKLIDEIARDWQRVLKARRLLLAGSFVGSALVAIALVRGLIHWYAHCRGFSALALAVGGVLLCAVLGIIDWSIWSQSWQWLTWFW